MAASVTRPSRLNLAARAARVMDRCDALANFTEEPGRITRSYGSPAAIAARQALALWMHEAGLETRIDAVGDVCGRRDGSMPNTAALLLGSHFDSVRDAGRYDGLLGILVALEAIDWLRASQVQAQFPIDLLAFADEEGVRFQTTYLGSCALAGVFDPAFLDLTDANGVTLREAMADFGGNPTAVTSMTLNTGDAFAYVEVHIEQGPFLESIAAPVGVVTAISGQTRILASLRGVAGHAGTVAMHLRRDPLPAAAEIVLAAEDLARQTPGLLATVGTIEVTPGTSNVIPGRVEISLDVRHPEDTVRANAVETLCARASELAGARSLELDWRIARDHRAVPCDPDLICRLDRAVAHSGHALVHLPSGAGHDAVTLSAVVPVGMLFVRCAGGISHHPAEAVQAEDVAVAIDVLDRFLASLIAEGRA